MPSTRSSPRSKPPSRASELARIDACAKRPIDIWTNYLYYPLSIRLVYLIRNTRITPNALTVGSLALALLGCGLFALGRRPDVLWGLLLVQVSYVMDCADGQLARYRQQFSPFGGWLDQVADRIKEFAIYFSLAYGYTRLHPGDTRVWMLATVALFALYLLEYYGQIQSRFGQERSGQRAAAREETAPERAPGAVQPRAAAEEDAFARMQRWRSLVPFRGFIIGEQYFALLVFLLCGAVYLLFAFVAALGLLMCIYRPLVQWVKYRRAAR